MGKIIAVANQKGGWKKQNSREIYLTCAFLYMYNADRAENQNLVSALSITINKILCQFFEFTQNLKRSR